MTTQSTRLAGRNAVENAERTPHLSSSLLGTYGSKTAEESHSIPTTLSASESISIEAIGRHFGASSVVVREVRITEDSPMKRTFQNGGLAESNAPAIPEGTHEAEIVNVEEKTSKNTNHPMLVLTCEVLIVRGNTASPFKLKTYYVDKGDEMSDHRFAQLAYATGIGEVKKGDEVEFVPEMMIGERVSIRVKHKHNDHFDKLMAEIVGLSALPDNQTNGGAKKEEMNFDLPPESAAPAKRKQSDDGDDVPF